jgi:hypothetical protein
VVGDAAEALGLALRAEHPRGLVEPRELEVLVRLDRNVRLHGEDGSAGWQRRGQDRELLFADLVVGPLPQRHPVHPDVAQHQVLAVQPQGRRRRRRRFARDLEPAVDLGRRLPAAEHEAQVDARHGEVGRDVVQPELLHWRRLAAGPRRERPAGGGRGGGGAWPERPGYGPGSPLERSHHHQQQPGQAGQLPARYMVPARTEG